MLPTPTAVAHNRRLAGGIAAVVAVLGLIAAVTWHPAAAVLLLIAGALYWFLTSRMRRRGRVVARPFPDAWEAILQKEVDFYRSLEDDRKSRFRQMVQVFLDEVDVTGVRTDVDETTRVLVAASGVIPVFGFEDWEYAGLGEVLIYPNSFDEEYQSEGDGQRNILGLVGQGHLRGVMVLSKPSLLQGFRNRTGKSNVGIHEFAHLVDAADGSVDGIPAGIEREQIDPWIRWVGRELRGDQTASDINDYAYTNEAEYFAVLSEYFFERPDALQQQHPKLYKMMTSIYHQNTRRLLSGLPRRRRRVGRNSPCPCGSGEKYKRCCKRKAAKIA